MGYHPTPIRMAIIKKTTNKQCRGSSKNKKELPHDLAISLLHIYIYTKKMKSLIKKDMHPNVYSSIIYNSQYMKMTVSINR